MSQSNAVVALATLNPAALVTLADCEQRIERGLKTYIDVGLALGEIRDSRLYRSTHETFEDYCRERWGFSDRRASQFIEAASVVPKILGTGLPAPAVESQARALAAVPEADRADVWRDVVEGDDKPTAAAIREAHEKRTRPTQSPGPADTTTQPADPGTTPAPVVDHSTTAPAVPPQEPGPTAEHDASGAWKGDEPGSCGVECLCGVVFDGFDTLAEAAGVLARHIETPEPDAPSAAPSGSGSAAVASPREDGDATAAPPAVRIEPTASERQLAEQRDARGLLLRAVEILAPAHDRPGFAKAWAHQLGPYDDELSNLIRRATDAIATLDDLIEGCGQ